MTDNFFVLSWKLTATEPNALPVNLTTVGIQDGANETGNLKAGHTFNASTKDNQSVWTIRLSGGVIEGV